MLKGEICGVDNCRSRDYRYGDDGYYYCQNGHRRDTALVTAEDEDTFGTQGRKSRKKAEEREIVEIRFKGRQAFEQFLLCYQLLLWKQSHWLVKSRGLPAELETIIRDLWALRLQKLTGKVENDFDAEVESQLQLYSSQTDTESEADIPMLGKRRKKSVDSTPSLIDTLGLCYLGLLLLRLPVNLGDLHRWATTGELTYYRAMNVIPPAMRQRLPSHYFSALEANVVLEPQRLQTAVLDLVMAYERDYGMTVPALNHPLLLFRYIKELALPLGVYPTATHLSKLVSYTFTYPNGLMRKSRYRDNDFPEAQLMSLLIIAVKLLYPFDEVRRHPSKSTEGAALAVDWDVWVKTRSSAKKETKTPGRLRFEEAMKVNDEDVFSMSSTQLDDYLNWYERTWTNEGCQKRGSDKDFRRALFEVFPTASNDPQPPEIPLIGESGTITAKLRRLKSVQGSLVPKMVVTEEEAIGQESVVKRPGNQYKRYRKVEDMPQSARIFFESAADIAGLSVKSLVRAVDITELRLRKWSNEERKKS
ncbi:hypothetical protein LTR16_002013 [Cryomyces antarcticus]|uniref:RRN7-type domain-containing protein n=1 Tax=Cryomyces antarcticus TaxID=329879 RepID=A0ABR0M868_9PEZI|nr:hypothetical protein LTR60_001485 [Cryomyces antarcticus]KAK5291889.1 hypothetical protein LTR16_002013 [Cryomyces antarcticus]